MTHYKCSVLKNVERVVFQINVTFCLKKNSPLQSQKLVWICKLQKIVDLQN